MSEDNQDIVETSYAIRRWRRAQGGRLAAGISGAVDATGAAKEV